MTVLTILATVALVLGVASAGMNAKTIYEIESDRGYVAAAEKVLQEQRRKVEEELAAARSRGDAVAVAQAEVLRDSLRLIERRSNVAAIGRQVEQTKASFLDEQWQQFKADLALRGISAGASRIGFGKVQDSYIRGTNWPPDPAKSIAIWDPKAKQAVRIMLEGDRPSLTVIQFGDDLEDTLTVVLNGYDVLKSSTGTGGQPRTAGEALEQIREALQRLGDLRPLPDTVGEYVAASLVKQARTDNPQIAGLSPEEQAAFLRDQACDRLRAMQAGASDLERSDALRAAQALLDCPVPARPTRTPTPTSRASPTRARTPTSTRTARPTATPRPRPVTTATPYKTREWIWTLPGR